MKLNPEQNEAVKFVSGPCLVLAGAGSGKTGVICQKIAYLIQKCDYKARNIAAVTFTNKAAREMKERIQKMLGRDLTRGLTVSTFHSLGLDIVRREINTLGYKPDFILFDDQDTLALLKELTIDELDGDKDLLSKLQRMISNWKNDLFLGTSLEPEHISAYSLTVEKNTALHSMVKNKTVLMPSEEMEEFMKYYDTYYSDIYKVVLQERN